MSYALNCIYCHRLYHRTHNGQRICRRPDCEAKAGYVRPPAPPRHFDMERGKRLSDMHDQGMTFSEIGRREGITGGRAGQIVRQYGMRLAIAPKDPALAKLRKNRSGLHRVRSDVAYWRMVNDRMLMVSKSIADQLKEM